MYILPDYLQHRTASTYAADALEAVNNKTWHYILIHWTIYDKQLFVSVK